MKEKNDIKNRWELTNILAAWKSGKSKLILSDVVKYIENKYAKSKKMKNKKIEIKENCIETFNAIEYFESFRMKELLKEDQFYIKHLIKHIKYLENERKK